jgi:hypothetical protein
MQTHEAKPDTEGAVIAFMLAFWPLLLVVGLIDHFLLPEYDLRLFTLALAGAAGWGSVRIQQRRAERLSLAEDSQ